MNQNGYNSFLWMSKCTLKVGKSKENLVFSLLLQFFLNQENTFLKDTV